RNPRARSARLRMARRTAAPALAPDPGALGLPRAPVAADFATRARQRARQRASRGAARPS
ncbi:MAG: hypothetical protein AAFN17_04145, partial [Pseudomonadota bacterium]